MPFLSQLFKNVKAREYITLILVSITFESIIVLIARRGDIPEAFDPWVLAALGFAAYRAGRAIAFNRIFEWLRAPFVNIVDDSSGAGKSNEAIGSGVRRVIGELLCCPICSATWSALVLFGVLVLSRPVGMTFIYVLAAAGIAEYLHWASERAEWQGRAAREESGTAWLLKNRGEDYRQNVVFLKNENHLTPEQIEALYGLGFQVKSPEPDYSSKGMPVRTSMSIDREDK